MLAANEEARIDQLEASGCILSSQPIHSEIIEVMWNRIRIMFALVVPFILLLVSASGPMAAGKPQAPTYTIIDLGTLGGVSSYAQGINARGQVVGGSATTAGGFHAFLWEAGTGMQDLGTLGRDFSIASGINAQGQVVGYFTAADFSNHAFLWEAGTGMQDLGTLGGRHSVASGINARGQVVGYSTTAADEFGGNIDIRPRTLHAVLWEPAEEVK